MTRTAIPWIELHELEDKYKHVTRINKNSDKADVQKLNQIIITLNPHVKTDKNIARYVDLGYSSREIEFELGVTSKRVNTVIAEQGLLIRPKFKYLLIDPYGESYFLAELANVKPFGPVRSNFAITEKSLAKRGFKLYRFDNHWFDLDRGDSYMVKGNDDMIFVK
ncbi:hypothetical protein OZX56_05365 [Lactobacillus sp. ESL0684]|uniref:hypothetical protein n=1 Tax=Lactobacillus sp. ESL0684 TaxID=2983213 RepID=UPI0023F6F41D|nr:hypothetical protein [Lactobacillus sp. ESL0684]WEV42978.1 hypothetical protein OZX56_05365 [Lactobacillus sp. ESL0684]